VLLRLLRLNSIWFSFVFILIWAIVWIAYGAKSSYPAGPIEGMPLYRLVASLIFSGDILKLTAGFVFVLLTGLYTAGLSTKYLLLGGRSHMPFVFFILIAGSRPGDSFLYPVLMALPFMLWSFDRLASSYRVQGSSYHSFEAGLLVGIASFFYVPAIVFVILVLIGIYLFRQANIREYLLGLTGFLLPFGFYFAGLFILDKPLEHDVRQMLSLLMNPGRATLSLAEGIWTGCCFLVLLISSYFMMIRLQTKKIIVRRSFILFFWWFVLSILAFFLIPSAGKETLVFAAVPVSYLFSEYFFNTKNKKWGEVLLWVIIISLILSMRFQII